MPRRGGHAPSIRQLWGIAKSAELGLDDEEVYAIVLRETGKDSIRNLSAGELRTVIRVLQSMKDKHKGAADERTDAGGNPQTVQLRRKIYHLCEELGWNDDPSRIQGFVRRMCRVDRLEWLTPAQCGKVIEGLKAMVKREAGGANG